MPEPCPCCHGSGLAAPDDPIVAATAWLVARGHVVTPDGRIRTAGAAALLGITAGTLRVRRACFDSLPYVRVGRHGWYLLVDVVAERARRNGA